MLTSEAAQRDYYEVLGIDRNAEPAIIKDAFRKLAMKYHPDRNKAAGAEERFKEIATAYAVLSDPAKKAAYDRLGFAGMQGDIRQENPFDHINVEDIFGGLNFDFGRDHLDHIFNHRRGPSLQGQNIEINLNISLERIAQGGNETIKLKRQNPCDTCQGSGVKKGTTPRQCVTCGGSGQIRTTGQQVKGRVMIHQISTCPTCGGKGTQIEHPCPACSGKGVNYKDEVLSVKIPRGIEEGMALRIPGKGGPGSGKNALSGDLFVIIRSTPDPRFERNGSDLIHRTSIPMLDAVLGVHLEIPTIEGTARVAIPAGTQPESVLRLKGKGLPEFGSERHGDLYLRVDVRVPKNLSKEERSLYEQLRALGKKSGNHQAGHNKTSHAHHA